MIACTKHTLTQLALSQSFQTLIPAICGLLSGALYRTDIGNIKRWRFPLIFQKLTIRFIKPFLVSPPIARSSATTPSQRPIVTGLSPVDNIMTGGLRNRRSTNTTNSSSVSETPAPTTDGGAPSVRVSFFFFIIVYPTCI